MGAAAESGQSGSAREIWRSVSEMTSEYLAARERTLSDRSLPSGGDLPIDHPMLSAPPKDEASVVYQAGFAEQLVAHAWHCEWLHEAAKLEAARDADAAARAGAVSNHWVDLPATEGQRENRAEFAAEARRIAQEAYSPEVLQWRAIRIASCGADGGMEITADAPGTESLVAERVSGTLPAVNVVEQYWNLRSAARPHQGDMVPHEGMQGGTLVIGFRNASSGLQIARAGSAGPRVPFINESNGTRIIPAGGFYLNVRSTGQCGCTNFPWAATITYGL